MMGSSSSLSARRVSPVAILALAGVAAGPALAQDLPGAEADLGSRYSVSIGADWTSDYYFRGIIQEDTGFIIQPFAEIGVELYSDDTFALSAFGGVWNSIHGADETADAGSGTPNLFETDFYGGLSASIRDVTVAVSYTALTSPSGAFDTVEEIGLFVSFDDSNYELIPGVTFSPSFAAIFEIGDDASDGLDRGTYIEIGIEPAYEIISDGDFAGTTFSIPTTVGLSADDYYEFEDEDGTIEDETFGYVSFGPQLTVPLPVAQEFGEVTLSGGVQLLFLGDNTEAINEDDDFEVIGTVGVSVAF